MIILGVALVLLLVGVLFAVVDLGVADQVASIGSFLLAFVALVLSLGPRHRSPEPPEPVDGVSVYDSATEPEAFQGWTYYADRGVARDKFSRDGTERTMGLSAVGNEAVGLNKSLRLVSGVVEFEYRVVSFDEVVDQVYFAVIPMEEPGIRRSGLIELGASVQDDSRNARSVYRLRYFVPASHYRDHAWHSRRMSFDFSNHDRAYYCIFAPRINEGLDRRGDAEVHVRNVTVRR